MLEGIFNAIKSIWNYLKRKIIKVLNFIKNIVNWFRNIELNNDKLPLAIDLDKIEKEIGKNLQDPNSYNIFDAGLNHKILPVVYNLKTGKIDHYNEVFLAEEVDQDTKNAFQGKSMVVLQ